MKEVSAVKQSLGYFSDNGLEYINTAPFAWPRAQINYLWNDTLISGVNQFGTGDGVFNDHALLYNHPKGRVHLINDGRRYFYLRDNLNGEICNTALFPVCPQKASLQTHVGLGYSNFEMQWGELSCQSRVFLAPDEPVEIWEFTIQNLAKNGSRSISLCPYVEWQLGGYTRFCSPYSYLRSTFDPETRSVVSYNSCDEQPHKWYNGFIATDANISQWCGGRRDFLGPFGTISSPGSLVTGTMSCAEAWCETLAGSFMVPMNLQAGETTSVTVVIGCFDTDQERRRLIGKTINSSYRRQSFDQLCRDKMEMFKKVWIRTPDEKVNRMINIWSKQQIQLCAEFGRDGARGFRDTLQDAWGIAPFNAPLARNKIIETLSHQHSDGHGVRGWLPLQPHHYCDGPAWIPLAVTAYLKETGDVSLLDEKVKFLDKGQASVLEHTLLGVRHLSEDVGDKGLVLAHEGDWNDSLNWMGRGGRGQSVWASIALYHDFNVLIELAEELLNDDKLKQEMIERRDRIAKAIQEHGWDGDWYLAGWSDAGNPVGSKHNKQGRCYLNPQTWAIMTGLAQGERREKCIRAIDELLESQHGSLTLVPAYTQRDENVGRVSVILPGMYENSTPYCHGTAFKIVADLVAGRVQQAWESWNKVFPDSASHPSIVSGCEPYAFTNQYLGPDNGRAGASISGWITGTAGWMFRCVLEYFCGIQPGYKGFLVKPCLPDAWPNVNIKRVLRGRCYDISIFKKSNKYEISVDGKPYDGRPVLYEGK